MAIELDYLYENINCNNFKGLCAFGGACDVIKPQVHNLSISVSDRYSRRSYINFTGEMLRIDSARLGYEAGTCYVPILKNFNDSIVLGQHYFNYYYTVFDQTATTETGFYTNQIAFGLSNKQNYGLEADSDFVAARRSNLDFLQFKAIKELEKVTDHTNLTAVAIACTLVFIVMLLVCILLVYRNLRAKHTPRHIAEMEEALAKP